MALSTGSVAFLSSYFLVTALLAYLLIVALLSHSPSLITVLLFCLLMSALLFYSLFLIAILLSRPFVITSLYYSLVSISLPSIPMPALLSHPSVPALLSSPISILLSLPIPTSLSLPVLTLLSLLVPVLSSRSVLCLALTHLTSSDLRLFKQALLNKPLRHHSTSPTSLSLEGPLHLFLILVPLSNCKRFFDIVFLNSCSLAQNHAVKELDLSFGECGCLSLAKLNWLWQLEL